MLPKTGPVFKEFSMLNFLTIEKIDIFIATKRRAQNQSISLVK